MGMVLLPEMAQASATAASAFCASNLDDIVLLLLLFSQGKSSRSHWHVVAGQYLGFSLLVLASLFGFVGGRVLPHDWIGVFGLIPVALGVSQFLDILNSLPEGSEDAPPLTDDVLGHPSPEWLRQLGLPWSPMAAVAALTVANGGDNVGLYFPLFAQANPVQLSTILVVFFLLVGVWCLAAWRLVQAPALADLISRHGRQLVPVVLIGIGLLILVESQTFSNRPLAVIVLSALLAMAWSVLRQLQHGITVITPSKVS